MNHGASFGSLRLSSCVGQKIINRWLSLKIVDKSAVSRLKYNHKPSF
jgi:hypothetical protein